MITFCSRGSVCAPPFYYREFCEGRRIAGKKKPCESFFYSVFERIDGVKFSDREATECGCPHCIGMVKWGWEEISRIVEQMLPLLDIEDVTRYELKVMFEQQLEASRRTLKMTKNKPPIGHHHQV